MIKTVRDNICAPYSLNDTNVISFEITYNNIVMRTQSGIIKTTPPYSQPDGYVEFHNVRWDFSYVYLLDFCGNIGSFSGEKLFLKDFIENFVPLGFCVMDETYGFNSTKLTGYLTHNRHHYECMIEIYHEGNMVFIAEE